MAIGSSRNENEPKLFLSGSLFEERLKEWLIITEVAMYFSQMN